MFVLLKNKTSWPKFMGRGWNAEKLGKSLQITYLTGHKYTEDKEHSTIIKITIQLEREGFNSDFTEHYRCQMERCSAKSWWDNSLFLKGQLKYEAIIPNACKDMEKLYDSCMDGRKLKKYSQSEKIFFKNKHKIIKWPRNHTLGIHPWKWKFMTTHKNLYTNVHNRFYV